jgi:phenylalanyl-tRNA synthetase beta chain
MKVSLKWLRQYIDLKLPASELALKITLAGTEVARMDLIGGWQNVFVASLVEINPHPNANRLRLATVEMGGVRQTVVCGAPNLTIGDKIAFARVGAELLDGHTGEKITLKAATIRGVLSQGMVCSEKELGLSGEHEGILVLPSDAPIGMPLSEYMGDVIFDLEVTPNRPDMLSVLGVAHEIGALTAETVREPTLGYPALGQPVGDSISVEIADEQLCPRYTAALIKGVKIGESPRWLKDRLTASGMRPISNVVDITNFVMLEYGQPLHAFDYDKINGHKIIIRRALENEIMTTLDGVERKLSAETLVISDPVHAIAIAGVMGGATSEVGSNTTNILLESASFKPASIHHTAAALKMTSEASQRFERGISPELTIRAARRAMQLMVELCGGTAASGIVDLYPGKKILYPISITVAEGKRILGLVVSLEQMEKILLSLGCELQQGAPGELLVSPPYWRSDLRITADMIEEIARVTGYEKIPYTRLSQQIPEYMPTPLFALKKKVKQTLAGFGACELMTYSITSRDNLQKGLNTPLCPEPLRLVNPMAAEQEYLRTSLRGNVLSALAANLRHSQGNVFLFELGHVYLPRLDDLPDEPEMLCGVLTSSGQDKVWHGRKEPMDFFDAKGVVEGLMQHLGVSVNFEKGDDPGLRSGHQTLVKAEDVVLGVLGEIHQQVALVFDLAQTVYFFEINVSALLPQVHGYGGYSSLPRFPVAERDLALVVDEVVTHKQIVDIIRKFSLVKRVSLFDVYAGKQVAEGKKSLAYSLTFQSLEHTLMDAEVDGVMGGILKQLGAELGAILRG